MMLMEAKHRTFLGQKEDRQSIDKNAVIHTVSVFTDNCTWKQVFESRNLKEVQEEYDKALQINFEEVKLEVSNE